MKTNIYLYVKDNLLSFETLFVTCCCVDLQDFLIRKEGNRKMSSTAMGTPKGSNLQNRNSQRSTLLKVVILGDGGVGKSCLMNRFVSNHFDEHSFHTIGVEFLNKDIEINGEAYTLQIWDTAGQERFKTLRTPFYRGSDICLLTYAVDDRTSFKNLTLWRSEFLKYADVREASTFPFIVIGNKVSYSVFDTNVLILIIIPY